MAGVTYQQMQELEQALFAAGLDAASLMAEAAQKMACYLLKEVTVPATLLLYLGKGNNAGDGILVAHHLQRQGWRILVRRAFEMEAFKPLPARHWSSFHRDFEEITDIAFESLTRLSGTVIVLDALLGIGSSESPRGNVATCIREIQQLRDQTHAKVFSVDVPSGLLEEGTSALVVPSDVTMTLGYPKKALFRDNATAWVGRLVWLRFDAFESQPRHDEGSHLLTAQHLRDRLPHRPFDFHKGQAGRVGLVAGSPPYLGAAVLAALGALRGGAGLITLYVKPDCYDRIVSKLPPEIMVKAVEDYREVLRDRLDVLAIGPGLIFDADSELLELMRQAPMPLVIDAEGLNLLARHPGEVLEFRKSPSVLTPHPGEMARLLDAYAMSQGERVKVVQAWQGKFKKVTWLYKGARTVIGSSDGRIAYNSTGSPGMACGGMGDVLTGLIAALMAQSMEPFDAACLGAWLSGRAAELAIRSEHASEESFSASDLAAHLGSAFQSLKRLED